MDGYCTVTYDGSKAPRGAEHLRAHLTVRGVVFPSGKPQSVPADLAAHVMRSAPAGTVTVEGTPKQLPPPMPEDARAAVLSQRLIRQRWGTDPAAVLPELVTPLSADARRMLGGPTKATIDAIDGGKLDADLYGLAMHGVLHGLGDVAAAAARRWTAISEARALAAG